MLLHKNCQKTYVFAIRLKNIRLDQIDMLLFLFLLKAVYSMDPEIKGLLTPLAGLGESETCGYDSCPKVRNDILNVHIVPHTHLELGYTRTLEDNYLGRDIDNEKSKINVKKIIDSVIAELWRSPSRKFTFSDTAYFFRWWNSQGGMLRRMTYQLLRQGRLNFVGGGWSMSEEATTSYHAIIDQFTYSLRKLNETFLDCGRPLVSWQSDIFGHSKQFASLMAAMGFDGHFINPISYDDELYRMTKKSMEFLWRGSDDIGAESDIFTHKLFDGYWSPPGFCFDTLCGDPVLVSSSQTFSNVEERMKLFVELMRTRQAPYYRSKNIMVVMGKRMAYFDAPIWFESMDRLMSAVNQESYENNFGVRVFYSTPACYLKAVHDANISLPTKQDDFYPLQYDIDTFATGLYTSRPTLKYIVRLGHVHLQMVKQLLVLSKLGINKKIYEDMMSAMGVLQDHSVLSGALRNQVKDSYMMQIYGAIQKSLNFVSQAFNKLRNSPPDTIYYRCVFNISSCHTGGDNVFILAYNALGWNVTTYVRLPVYDSKYKVLDQKGDVIKSVRIILPEPVLKLSERIPRTHELVFLAENLPPLGFKSYYIEKISGISKRTVVNVIKEDYNKSKVAIRQSNPFIKDELPFLLHDELNDIKDYEEYMNKSFDAKLFDIVHEDKNLDLAVSLNPSIKNNSQVYNASDFATSTSSATFTPTNSKHTTITEQATDATVIINDKLKTSTDAIISNTMESIKTDRPDTTTTTKEIPDQSEISTNQLNIIDKTTYISTSTINYDNINLQETESDLNVITLANKIDKTTDFIQQTLKPNITLTTKLPSYAEVLSRKAKGGSAFLQSERSDTVYADDVALESADLFIQNKYVKVYIDKKHRKVSRMLLSNRVIISLDIQFYYYASDDPDRLNRPNEKKPGAYIFRPMDPKPEPVIDFIKTKVYKSDVVQEIHCSYSDWASFSLRLYNGTPFVELDWLVGPVPIDDEIGKEVFIRYRTNLINDKVFYTDANGKQTIKRIRNRRASYPANNIDPIAGNIYPVTSKIYIEDLVKNTRFTIFTDRAQGGTSLYDGEIDLMLHRRILTEDLGIKAHLNEIEKGLGITVRGSHYMYLTKANYKPNRIFEKKYAKEVELKPQILVSKNDPYGRMKTVWFKSLNEFSGLKNKLPVGVHLLSFEYWSRDSVLIRFENFLEYDDVIHHGIKRVFIQKLFKGIKVKNMAETSLAGNIWLKEWSQLKWNIEGSFVRSFNNMYGNSSAKNENLPVHLLSEDGDLLKDGIILKPQQIRTFVVWYE